MIKKIEPRLRLWKVALALGIVMAATLALGSTYPEDPKFLAQAETLSPEPVKQKPAEPIVVSRTEYVTATPSPVAPTSQPVATPKVAGGNGYIMPGDNCVACAQALTGRAQSGDAGSHVPTHSVPKVGDIMIWYPGEQGAGAIGHVGVVVGVNGDGTVNIAHCNWGGGQTTFASTGKFY